MADSQTWDSSTTQWDSSITTWDGMAFAVKPVFKMPKAAGRVGSAHVFKKHESSLLEELANEVARKLGI